MKKDFQFILPNKLNHDPMDENVVQKLISNYLQIWKILDFQLGKIESKGEKFEEPP